MKKLEIHVFSGKTFGGKRHEISIIRVAVYVIILVFAIAGFIFFAPTQIMEHMSGGSILSIHRQNDVIKKDIRDLHQSIDKTILKAEGVKFQRDSALNLGGLGFMLEKGNRDTAHHKSFSELEASFSGLLSKLESDSVLAASIPIIHPLKNEHVIKNRFDMILDPFTEQMLPHTGIDFVASMGDTVYATGAGYIDEVVRHQFLGLYIKVKHSPKISTFYAHLDQALVQPGSHVRRGQPIALVGRSGKVSSVSLHYEIRLDGTPINPEDYFITK